MIAATKERTPSRDNSRLFRYNQGEHISNRAVGAALREDGFAVITGIPIDAHRTDTDRKEATVEFLSRFPFLRGDLNQNSEGDTAWIVRNSGIKVIYDSANRPKLQAGKGSASNDHLGFHNDAAAQWHGHNIVVVGLLAFSQAEVGGETTLIDARDAYSVLRRENPRAAKTLRDTDFYFDRTSGYDEGQLPYVSSPIIKEKPIFQVRYSPRIHQGFEVAGRELTAQQQRALDAWEEVLGREELHVNLKLQPGDLILLNENITLHARSRYEDDSSNPRTLVRVWKHPVLDHVT